MSEKLIDAILTLDDAAAIRYERQQDPARDVDETTEDDVRAALVNAGATPLEVLRLTPQYTDALRAMLSSVDPKE